MIKKKEKVFIIGQMEGDTKVSGKKANNMTKVANIQLQRENPDMVFGKMEKEYNGFQTAIKMKMMLK